ncbi:MAG: hypothetical protein KTR25_16495 [Myxococcales bacterium]|nr:hypothetical protein [Myxococcales bacterium]
MMRKMVESRSLLRIQYASYRALSAHYTGHMVNGAIPVSGVDLSSIIEGDIVVVELQSPDYLQFVISTRIERISEHQDALLTFAPEEQAAVTSLHQYISTTAFISALEQEPHNTHPRILAHWQVDTLAPTTESSKVLQSTLPPVSKRSPSLPPAQASLLRADIRCPTVLSFISLLNQFEPEGLLQLTASNLSIHPQNPIKLKWILPGYHIIEMTALISRIEIDFIILILDKSSESFNRLCRYNQSYHARARREREIERGQNNESHTLSYHWEPIPEPQDNLPLSRRIQRLSTEQKINLALSGKRQERMALARDSNRQIHHYVLKNARITLEEIIYIARLPYVNPDVLHKIAEDRQLTRHTAVIKALVGNPRTPVASALRLVGRLSRADLMELSRRTGMPRRLLQSIRAKLKQHQ